MDRSNNNLSDTYWERNIIGGHHYHIIQCYLNALVDIGCWQTVNFPTRLENALDIFSNNHYSGDNKATPTSGLSNHDAILSNIQTIPH